MKYCDALPLFALALLLAAPAPAHASDEAPLTTRHAVFFEAGGPSVVYSANYEYRLLEGLAVGGGASVFPVTMFGGTQLVPTLNAGARGILFEGSHHLELGASVMVAPIGDDDAAFFVPTLGYRYQAPRGGLLFRATFTPLFRLNDLAEVLPWGGLSAGWGF